MTELTPERIERLKWRRAHTTVAYTEPSGVCWELIAPDEFDALLAAVEERDDLARANDNARRDFQRAEAERDALQAERNEALEAAAQTIDEQDAAVGRLTAKVGALQAEVERLRFALSAIERDCKLSYAHATTVHRCMDTARAALAEEAK